MFFVDKKRYFDYCLSVWSNPVLKSFKTKGISILFLLYDSFKERFIMRVINRFCGFLFFWMSGYILSAPFAFPQSANDVIINEILHGSTYKDAVELMVVKPGGADLRGWIITDLFSPTGTASSSEGTLTFPNNPFLASVPQFTRVVMIADAGGSTLPIATEDTSAAGDSTIVLLPTTLGGSLIHDGSNRFNLASNDNVVLVSGPNLSAGTVIDAVSYGGNISGWTTVVWVNNLVLSSGNFAYFTNDSIGGFINDNGETGKGWTSGVPEANHTLGRINPGQLTGGKSIRIRNIARNPVSPKSSQPVVISATVGSLNAVSSVRTIYYYDSVKDSTDMALVSDSTYRDTIPAMPKNTKVYYYVKAVDAGSNVEISAVDSFTVSPSIAFAQITRSPLSPDSNQNVIVTARISSFNPVASAKLFYSLKGVTDSVTMSNTSDSTYQGTIPAKKVDDTVSYYIKVTDNAGQTEISSSYPYIVVLPVVITPIATIQANSAAYQNQVVTLAGIVVIGDYKLITTRRNTYLVDRSNGINGIQIFSPTFTGDTLKRGDSVVVKGMILDYQNITEITHPTSGTMEITIISRNNEIPPANNRTVTQISDIGREGEWVRIKGNVNSKSSAGGGDNIIVEDGSGVITVRVWNTTGMNTANILVNNSYSFKGIVGIYSPSTQLLAAYDEDVTQDTSAGGGKAMLKVSPYPFNPMSGEVIRYALRYGDNSRIIVRLFDLSGRLVTTLVDQVKTRGNDETDDPLESRTWNGRTVETRQLVPAGTYLMHLEVTNRQTGKSSSKTAPIVIGTKLK